MKSKFFITPIISNILEKKGCPFPHTYCVIIDWLDSKGYVITIEVAYYDINNYSFRSNLYYKAEKIYTSEWMQSREKALDASILKTLEDYL